VSNIIATDAQSLEQDAEVILFQLDATKKGGDLLFFTCAVSGGGPVSFGGQVYTPLPIQAEGFSWTSGGAIPRPTLTIGAANMALISLVVNSKDLVGCPIRRIRTYRKYLDDGSHADGSVMYPVDYYQVEKKSNQNRKQIQFELSADMDQEGRMVPARQVLRDTCTRRYRYWDGTAFRYEGVTCPYVQSAMFDRSDNPTTDPTKDACGKRLGSCETHFGRYAVLPFYGYPGVGRL
jgi:lambda family phage minor tail protein L